MIKDKSECKAEYAAVLRAGYGARHRNRHTRAGRQVALSYTPRIVPWRFAMTLARAFLSLPEPKLGEEDFLAPEHCDKCDTGAAR